MKPGAEVYVWVPMYGVRRCRAAGSEVDPFLLRGFTAMRSIISEPQTFMKLCVISSTAGAWKKDAN